MGPHRWVSPTLIISLLAAIGQANGQSTQGLITGRVIDAQTRRPVAKAAVRYWRTSADGTSGVVASGSTQTGTDGLYALPFLTPEPSDYGRKETTIKLTRSTNCSYLWRVGSSSTFRCGP